MNKKLFFQIIALIFAMMMTVGMGITVYFSAFGHKCNCNCKCMQEVATDTDATTEEVTTTENATETDASSTEITTTEEVTTTEEEVVEVEEVSTTEVYYEPTTAAATSEAPPAEVDGMTYLGTYSLTAYCACANCCGKSDGITASGTQATAGRTVACNSLPMGTVISINGHQYVVEDTGGMGGNVIDIFFDNHEEALNFGRQSADVYLVN